MFYKIKFFNRPTLNVFVHQERHILTLSSINKTFGNDSHEKHMAFLDQKHAYLI